MQNWNQWQLPAGPVTAPMPQPPIGYSAPGADPMATMQAYLQYYNQPNDVTQAPSGYTPEQWAAAQQQNWAQWQTWQQQYQQWQAQYGEKYQETLKQMSSQGLTSVAPVPASTNVPPPPLPKEDSSSKPPLPPESSAFGFPGMPPPHQNNLPLFPSRSSENPPLPSGQPPLPPDNSRFPNADNTPSGKRVASSNVDTVSAKKMKVEDEELTEAEKTFDAQFKQWEEQFNKWKQQNANHPDKTQYKQYEAKWTSWREKLIERREQMRRKREQQKQVAAKAEAEKDKSLVGDDKILNSILTSTENEGLINNLLGIGKTLGLTGKNDVSVPPSGPPPVATMPQHPMLQATAMGAPTMTPNMTQAAWAAQQWAAQYNAGMNMTNYNAGFTQAPAILQPPGNVQPAPMSMPNFNQPPANFNQPPANFNQPPPGMLGVGSNFSTGPPNMSTGGPNFSQPPPGFGASNNPQQMDSGQDRRSGQGNSQDLGMRSFRSDGDQRQGQSAGRDSIGCGTDRFGFEGNRFSGPPPNDLGGSNRGGKFSSNESYGRDGSNKDFGSSNQFGLGSDNNRRDDSARDFSPSACSGNEFRSGNRIGNEGDRFGPGFDRDQGGNRFGRDGDKQDNHGDNRPGGDPDNFSDRFGSNNDRFGSNNDRLGPGNDRFGSNIDRFRPGNDRLSSDNDRFGSNNDRFGSNNDRFSANNDRFGSNNDRFGSNNDRFGSNNDRFGSNNDRFGSNNDRFGPSNDRFSSGNDQSKSDVDRFGSSNDRFRPGSDQFGPTSGDRFGLSSDRSGQSNDKFSRPPPDRFDLRDGSRDSAGSNSRSFGKSGGFDPPADMPPELQKLMAKRKAAMDVFKPSSFGSFLNSDKNSSASPSLSESFRRITGDSPFLPRSSTDFGKKDNPGLRGPPMSLSGSGGPGNFESSRDVHSGDSPNFKFRGPGDFRPPGPGDFQPRDSGEFGSRGNEFGPRDSGEFGPRDNEFAPRDSGNFGLRSSEFGPRGSNDFGPPRGNDFPLREPNASGDVPRTLGDFWPRMGNEFAPRIGNETESSPRNERKREGFEFSDKRSSTPENSDRTRGSSMRQSPPMRSMEERKETEENFNEPPGDSSKNDEGVHQKVPPLQMPPWMSSEFADDDIVEIPINNPEKTIADPSKDKSQSAEIGDSSRAQAEDSEDTPMGGIEQKSNVLPFMGENDPKPEDLNMEPPPELPNLGPIKESEPILEQRGGPDLSGPFGCPSGDSDRQMNFDRQFGPQGMQMKPKGPMPFGPRGLNDSRLPLFGSRGMPGMEENVGAPPMGPFGAQGPSDIPFGSRGPHNDSFDSRGQSSIRPFGPRGPAAFGPRGPSDFRLRGPSDFGSRDPNDRPFDPRGVGTFGPPGPLDRPFPGASNDAPFGQKPPFASNTFAPRGNLDNSGGGIPSLMSFKFDRPIGPQDAGPAQNKDEFEGGQSDDLPPAFRGGDQDQRPFGGKESHDNQDMDQGSGSNMPRGADWRQPFGRNKFGDSDQRSGSVSFDAPPVGPEDKMEMGRERMFSGQGDRDKDLSRFGPDDRIQGADKDIKSGSRFDEISGGSIDKDRISGSNFITRRLDDRSGRDGPRKEFCVEKQFNYNHSGGMPDEISTELSSVNVIDYAHASRVIVHDYVTPAECFEYDHGKLKPIVTDHEVYPRKDFRNWVENEQNLREYTDRMRIYESEMRILRPEPNDRHSDPLHLPSRDHNRIPEDRRSFDHDRRPTSSYRNERSRRDRDSDDHRERDRGRASRERGRIERDREWERSSNKHREDRSQHRRSNSKDRTRERSEKIRKEPNKENKKNDERSKGNVSGQENSAKKPAESTSPDNSKLERKDGESEEPAKVVEVSKIVEAPKIVELPTTMELPKTPNFTMIDDLLCEPGRPNRPPKIVVILRGPPGSGKSFVAKLIKDKEVEQGGSAPRILSLDDYFLTEKEIETEDDNGKKVTTKEMVYEYEEAMEPSYMTSLIKAFKKNITDGFFNFIILDSINEKISDYEEMWSFAKTKGFRVYVCEMEMDVQICLKRNIHNRTEDEVNRIVDYFEPTPGYHQKLDVTSMLQEEAIEEVHMEDSEEVQAEPVNDDSQDSQEDPKESVGVSKWERMEAEDKLDRLDGLAKRKSEGNAQTMEDFLQVPDYYNMEDTSGKKRVRWADLEERKEQEKMRAVGFVVGQTNWDRMMDPTKGGSALTRTKYI